MAAPDTDVSLQIEPSKTPAKLEDLSKEGKTPQEGEQSWEGTTEEQRKEDVKKASTPTEETRPPWKGVLVECAKLWTYLSGVATFERTNMLRKGREVHKIYVEVIKGKTFLDDQFTLTEFGRMVLQNGTIRAGRAKNAKQIVVARETLYCSGSGACKRACGYYGECMPGCDKTKMRGHKCSYRVKLTMRLGYVNHWFVEVLGSHDQFAASNYNLSQSIMNSPLSKSNSPSSPNQRTPPSGRKPESPCHSPKMTSSPNKNLPNSDALSNGAINTMPMNLPTHNLPNSLAPLINNLPNSVLSSQMGLPLGFQHVLPIASQSAIFPSQGNHGNLASLFAGASSQYFPITQNTDHSSPQDVPLPLVKVKKEPMDVEIEKAVAMEINEALNRNGLGISSPPQERAKARKRFTPVQRENRMFSINSMATDSDRNGTRHDLDSHVRKELRELVTRREHERGAMGSTADSVSNDSPINYSINGDKNCDDAYTYVWDGDTRSSEVNDGEGKPKDLISRVQQLESHVKQLRNVVLKNQGDTKHSRKQKQKEFDFKKYNTRHVALKISYLGWDYHGFAVQEDTDKTIELALFDALIKTKLIESREVSNYHRCGRTDKGVSAFSQVISIDLRTNLLEGPGVKVREDGTANDRPGDKTLEIKYVHILNKVLPQEIRVLAWTPVNKDFSARFDCKKRTYKYFFPKGNLNLQIMSEAADKLVGEHDFRNFCKMDVGNGVVNFMRRIVKADIAVLDERDSEYQMCELTITGLAFLWHQIRCIVTVLFLVGQGNEKPQIIDELLDIDKHPRKPQYSMASELPLNLFDCEFSDDIEWIYEADWHEENIRHLQQMWAQHAVRTAMLKRMLEAMDTAKVETDSDIAPWVDLSPPLYSQSDWIVPGKVKVYKPLLDRQKCESLEDRIEHFAKRRKIMSATESSAETT
ncbi:uncharacterized protein LOC134692826 [Mytilus trossulus]|uniref:uncharacterized protein LOC134692826 n=1 Tax=Mytilus trossulus TaxID=6551 RepID=UPI0030076CFD